MARQVRRPRRARAKDAGSAAGPGEPTGAAPKGRIAATLAAAAALIIGVGLAVVFLGNRFHAATVDAGAAAVASAPSFVGSEACAQCHPAEARLWRTSQHRDAMDHATDKTVLGDFS